MDTKRTNELIEQAQRVQDIAMDVLDAWDTAHKTGDETARPMVSVNDAIKLLDTGFKHESALSGLSIDTDTLTIAPPREITAKERELFEADLESLINGDYGLDD